MAAISPINFNYTNYQIMPAKIIQTEESKKVRDYSGDLSAHEKSYLNTAFIDENTLKITFSNFPNVDLTIRRQDIFESGAKVIVNAANSHLGGGGGIDGAIHAKGGRAYAECHQELQKQYLANYVLGHAAMIFSGELKNKYNIENVIVVAGPQGETTYEKESALYSCYYNSLELADFGNKLTIAYPSISTGIFNFPREKAAAISLKAINDYLSCHPKTKLESISIHFLENEPKDYLENYLEATV